jgi:formyltetrahydrofolate deformylase
MSQAERPKMLAVASVVGRDQKGVVAKISTYLANQGVNIEDIEQRVIQGLFIMNMLLDLRDMRMSLDELVTGLLTIGKEIGMEIKLHLHNEPRARSIAVLVSFEPQCLVQLVEDAKSGALPASIGVVLSNHPQLESVASEYGIPFFHLSSTDKAEHERFLIEKIDEYRVDAIALARYMQIVSPQFVERYRGRIINIHPSLLPYFPGANAYRQAWEDGARVSGCTAHFVTAELDKGPIILQDVFHIDVGKDSVEEVKQKGMRLEGQTLSKALQLFLNEEIVIIDDKVVFKPSITGLF